MTAPRFACALSTDSDSNRARTSVLDELGVGLDGLSPDLLTVFATHHHGAALESIGRELQEATGAAIVLGCTGEAVIGGAHEAEGSPGLALWAGHLPGTELKPLRVRATGGEQKKPVFDALPQVSDPERAGLLILADPFTFPMDAYLKQLNEEVSGLVAVGGMASGGMGAGQSLLITAKGLEEGGAIGVTLEGDVELLPVVSQGCRPVGKPYVITGCEQNLIRTLGGQPAMKALIECMDSLPLKERKSMQGPPFIGLAIDARKSEFERGDFLVRGILAEGPDRSLAVNEIVRRGQTIQFLLRDAESAGEDLRALVHQYGGGPVAGGQNSQSAGALLFSCNGRGKRMFECEDHDLGCVRDGIGPDLPVAGFFAAGEVGPVGGRNFLHGYTASVAVFRAR